MIEKQNIIKFPDNFDKKKNKYIQIRDDIENLLFQYAYDKNDLWAVSLAAGRFSSMNLEKIDGTEKTIEFFRKQPFAEFYILCLNTINYQFF